jgi:hypothetical protein
MILACSHVSDWIAREENIGWKIYELKTPMGSSFYCKKCISENKLTENIPDTYFEYEPLKEALAPICATCFEELVDNESIQVIGEIKEAG